MSKKEFIEENYKELRAFVYASYKRTVLKSFYEFDDFFNEFIIYLLKYDTLKENPGYWVCIRKQMKSFIMIQYKVINTQKRKANDNYYKISNEKKLTNKEIISNINVSKFDLFITLYFFRTIRFFMRKN